LLAITGEEDVKKWFWLAFVFYYTLIM
jgi:hypothetical protein